MNIELFQWLVIAFIGIYSGLYWFNAAKCILSLRACNVELKKQIVDLKLRVGCLEDVTCSISSCVPEDNEKRLEVLERALKIYEQED